MPESELRGRSRQQLCGMAGWHPAWMQKFATTKVFIAVYGLLGTIQAMSHMYFMITLTTLEKRFKIPSQTMGFILSGNEISQILFSLILSYAAGQRNRPRWIAWGIVFCGLSCYILALPHFIYGAGPEALLLTKEYYSGLQENSGNMSATSILLLNSSIETTQTLCGVTKPDDECESLITWLPLILIFLSQFVLGVGNTLYYTLGHTYLDDNTKKTNTPLMLAVAMSLRLIGPIVGFPLGFISLNIFIDPTKTPLIDNTDPRWLGAWWFGWTILGTLMVFFSGLIGFFPKELPPRRRNVQHNSHLPHALKHYEVKVDVSLPIGSAFSSNVALDIVPQTTSEYPKLADFPKALMRLLRNKLLMYNAISGIFYIVGTAGYMTFFSKYMEVQFQKNSQNSTIFVGPISILGMVVGLLASGVIISKYKPSPSKVLMWNVIVGFIYVLGQISYTFMFCNNSASMLADGKINFSRPCNANCSCDGLPYSPVCHVSTKTTYFSACHAGCTAWDTKEKNYYDCSCLVEDFLNSTTTTMPTNSDPALQFLENMPTIAPSMQKPWNDLSSDQALPSTRLPNVIEKLSSVLQPGSCTEGCEFAFYTFSIASLIINSFASSGRIGNLLVNYRCVSPQDKAFAQGLLIMLLSLFGLIPGPIIFGRLIDSTCLVWTETCNGRGNCQLYNQTAFRYITNGAAGLFTILGIVFDVMVWKHGRHLDLYGEKETQRLEEAKRRNKAIKPLLTKE